MKVYDLIKELSRYDADTEVIILKPEHDYCRHQSVTYDIEVDDAGILGRPERVKEDWLANGGDEHRDLKKGEELEDVVVLS
jgi:hypothetical protein